MHNLGVRRDDESVFRGPVQDPLLTIGRVDNGLTLARIAVN